MHFFPSRTICFFIFALWVPVLSMAQSRALGGDALVLDDNHGNTLTLTYGNIPPVLGNSTLIFPPGGGSLLVGTGTIGRLPLWTGAAALGNSAIGDNGLAVSITNGESFFVSGTTGTTPASGAGTRMEWIPAKGAFRAGNVTGTQWDDGNIGLYSFAMGDGTTASAQLSTALGEFTTASGGASTALGDGSLASGGASLATGFGTTASGDYTTALGYHANTNNEAGAFVYGDHSTTTDLLANNPDEFDVRAAGGVNFYTKSDLSTGVSFPANGGITVTGGPVVQTSEQIAAGGTLDGKASIYNLTSGASTSTAAPTSTTAQVIYVHNATGNSQTIAGASVADGHSATIVYFPGTGWVVTNVY